jgi:uncharacterized repeat protein (TIGR01451 family)
MRSQNTNSTVTLHLLYGGSVGGTLRDSNSNFCTTAPPNPTLDKQVDKLVAAPGDTLTYTIRFGNAGGTNMTAAQIVDTLPAGVTFVSSTLNGSAATAASVSGQQRTYNVRSSDTATVGQVTAGQSGTLVITATVSAPFTGPSDTLTNSVSMTSGQTSSTSDTIVTSLQRPSVTITKSASQTLLVPGDTVTYTLRVLNSGPGTAANVTVGDALPATAYFTYVAGSAKLNGSTIVPDPVAANVLSKNIGSLAAGSTATVTVNMLVASSGVPSGTTAISNTATVSDGGTAGTRASDPSPLTISTNPNLTFTKTSSPASGPVAPAARSPTRSPSPTPAAVTRPACRCPTWCRRGPPTRPAPCSMPGRRRPTRPGDDNASFDAGGNRVLFAVGTLTAGSTRILAYTVTVDSPLSNGVTTLGTTATATATNAATRQATASITTSAAPLLTLVKSAPASVPFPLTTLASAASASTGIAVANAAAIGIGDVISIGGAAATVTNVGGTTVTLATPVTASSGTAVLPTWEYRLAYANNGTASATGVVITDALPAGLTFISADNGGVNAAGSVTWNLGTVAAGAGGTLRVRVRPGSATTYANSATLASAELPTVTSNSTSTTTGSLTVDKATTTPSGLSSGNATTATYVITLQNQSPAAAATGITVQDDLAAGFSYAGIVSIAGASATTSPVVGDASPTWTGLSIPAGATATITFTAKIANVSPGTYQNYLHRDQRHRQRPRVRRPGDGGRGRVDRGRARDDGRGRASRPSIAPGATLTMTVADPISISNPAACETVQVSVVNTRAPTSRETVTLTETGAGTGVFSGTLTTNALSTAGTNNSAPLNVAGGDTVRVSYSDA